MNGTTKYPVGPDLPDHISMPGLEWNSDIYYIEWTGSLWNKPKNLGSNINTVGNECCVWVSPDEREMIFYRDSLGLTALGASGNYRATRADRNAAWSAPTLLPGVYGSKNQSTTKYRHDIHKTAGNDLYLWEKDPASKTGAKLLYGKYNGSGWNAPVVIAGTDSLADETQPWVSSDELTLLFNRRDVSGDTTLMRMTRASKTKEWSGLTEVPLSNFGDSNGLKVWGEPTFSALENAMLYIRFNTSKDPWRTEMMYAPGTSVKGFGAPVSLTAQ